MFLSIIVKIRMMTSAYFTLSILVTTVLCYRDQTRLSSSGGADVVEAVIGLIKQSCIFPDDNVFLRRLAFVASDDGEDPETYRHDYDGGIWQIDETKFKQITGSSNAQHLFSAISEHFGIYWPYVNWSELRKPLFSGLAAALLMSTLDTAVSRNLEEQAAFYANHFNADLNAAQHFFTTATHLNRICKVNYLDLVLLVDTSSSLEVGDVDQEKNFAIKLVDSLNIGPDAVQVAFVTFSSGFKTHFKLNDYTTKEEVKRAISNITYRSGATDTGPALKYVTENVFSVTNGNRDDIAKVILLVTDGRSTDNTATISAASEAKQKGILIFVIGVGKHTSDDEMKEMASSPNCTHVKTLQGYVDLDSIVDEIQDNLCEVPVVLNSGSHRFHCQQSRLLEIASSAKMTTITIMPIQGTVNIFGSFFTSTPKESFSDFVTSGSWQTGAAVFVLNETRPLYLNVSSSHAGGCTDQFVIDVLDNADGKTIIRPDAIVTCIEDGIVRKCSVVDVLDHIYTVMRPPLGFLNPCVPGYASYQPHPSSFTIFLYCSLNGTVYLIHCPADTVYDLNDQLCVLGEPSNTRATITPLPSSTHSQTTPAMTGTLTFGSPCTKDNLDAARFFHPYPPDPTKYIVCTNASLYGIVKNCPPHKVWNQTALVCSFMNPVTDPIVDPTKEVLAHLENKCKGATKLSDVMFFAHPTDVHKYIQCGLYGNAYVKTCPQHKFWVQSILTCIPHGLFLEGTNLIGKR